jgi:hypothetical protein
VETESSLSCLGEPSTCLDSEPDKSNPLYLFISLFHIHFNIILPPTIWPPKRSFPPNPTAHSLTQAPSHAACSSSSTFPISSGTLQPVFCPHVTVQSQFQSGTNNSCTLCSKQQEHQRSWTELRQQIFSEFDMRANLFVSANSIFWMKSPCYFTKRTIWHIKNSNVN